MMNIFPSGHIFMVNITDIMGDVATGTIEASSTVTIYFTIYMTTPTISSTSTIAAVIVLFESRTVRAKMINTTFVSFSTIIMRRVAFIICPLRMCCVYFRKSNVSEVRPVPILEEFSILILKIPTDTNWDVFGIGIIILHLTRVFEIILGFHLIGISIVIKNILIENLT